MPLVATAALRNVKNCGSKDKLTEQMEIDEYSGKW